MEPMEYYGSMEQFLCEKATIAQVPINGILELTPLCNMNCEMCFVRLSPEERKQKGHLRSAEEWIFLAEQMKQAGTLFVLLTGGEPLLYPEFKKVYLALRKMGMIITINTNGTLIDDSWADFFAQEPPRRINITLYGKDADTYERLCQHREGFSKTLQGIQKLQERGIALKINGSITKENVSEIDELYSLAEQKNLVWKFDTYMYPAERERSQAFSEDSRLTPIQAAEARVAIMRKQKSQEQFLAFVETFVKKGSLPFGEEVENCSRCRAGKSSFVVNWQGMMMPCIMLSEMKEPVFEIDFSEAWKRTVENISMIRLNSKCTACPKREVCQTCAACAFLESGAYNGIPEYMCRYTEETLRLLKRELE